MDTPAEKKPIVVFLAIGFACAIFPFVGAALFYFSRHPVPPMDAGTVSAPLAVATSAPAVEVVRKTAPPAYARGIYLTAYSANRDAWRGDLIAKMKKGRINTVVIDIKDYSGHILYASRLPAPLELGTVKPQMKDVGGVLDDFHAAGIYVIARQTVFQDPALARARPGLALKTYGGRIWYDASGLAWMDPQSEEVWEYNLAIAREAAELGFDEINFDYMRFPSDGNIKAIDFNLPASTTKADIMEKFYARLSGGLSDIVNISIDMFGLVLDNAKRDYDLGIGQRLVGATPYFDYICPMTYPSHYPSGYLGLGNPAAYPAAVLSYDIKTSESYFTGQRAALRPWLQAFDMGAVYDKRMIDAETDTVETATSTAGWQLWNARNYYPDYIFAPASDG